MGSGRLKSCWSRVAFGDMTTCVNDRIDNPADAGVERYVGLEHLDSDSLTIRRWGVPNDVSSTKLRFRAGDLIFGRRRVYQRKLGVADFDGICSAHALVLRANPEVVVPQFLPFFMQTDIFMDRAKSISVGSLSPTINWTTLAVQEFSLPPLDEQRRIVGLLHASLSARETSRSALTRVESLIDRYAIDTYRSIAARESHRVPANDFGYATMGRQKSPKYCRGVNPRPYIRVANVGRLQILFNEIHEMDFSPAELAKYRLRDGDILVTEGDLVDPDNVGRPAVFRNEIPNCCFQNTLIRFRPNSDVPSFFVLLLFEGARLNRVFARAAKTTTVTHLGLHRFTNIMFPLPDTVTQRLLADRLELLLAARQRLTKRIEESGELAARFVVDAFEQ